MAKAEKQEKKPKKAKSSKPTPGSEAYRVVLGAIESEYDDYAAGEAENENFPSPGKQKKVAKQLAKHHNRLLKKSKLTDIDELDEDPE